MNFREGTRCFCEIARDAASGTARIQEELRRRADCRAPRARKQDDGDGAGMRKIVLQEGKREMDGMRRRAKPNDIVCTRVTSLVIVMNNERDASVCTRSRAAYVPEV